MTLQEFLKNRNHTQEFIELIGLISGSAGTIRAEFLGGDEKMGTFNIYGEEQIAIDKKANIILIDLLSKSGIVSQIASEEEPEVLKYEANRGHYGVTIDPLDGSSLIKTDLAVGTIVSIYENGEVLSGLSNITAALYILYGPLTLLVFADENGTSQFAQNSAGEFLLVKENMTVPEGNLYGSGGLRKEWTDGHKKYIETLEAEGFKLRYSGSSVPDVHQVLTYGGVFTYPGLLEKPKGKLRLIIEVGPSSFIMEKAGGAGTNGIQRILELTPQKVDDRTPAYIGSKGVVERVKEFLA